MHHCLGASLMQRTLAAASHCHNTPLMCRLVLAVQLSCHRSFLQCVFFTVHLCFWLSLLQRIILHYCHRPLFPLRVFSIAFISWAEMLLRQVIVAACLNDDRGLTVPFNVPAWLRSGKPLPCHIIAVANHCNGAFLPRTVPAVAWVSALARLFYWPMFKMSPFWCSASSCCCIFVSKGIDSKYYLYHYLKPIN